MIHHEQSIKKDISRWGQGCRGEHLLIIRVERMAFSFPGLHFASFIRSAIEHPNFPELNVPGAKVERGMSTRMQMKQLGFLSENRTSTTLKNTTSLNKPSLV